MTGRPDRPEAARADGAQSPPDQARPEAAAPAVGTAGVHRAQQEEIIRQAFARD